MMAWVRTGTSLITFGFSVYKFFQFEMAGKDSNGPFIGARGFALVLIGIGLVVICCSGTIEHRRDLRSMRQDYPGMPTSMSTVVALLMAAWGRLHWWRCSSTPSTLGGMTLQRRAEPAGLQASIRFQEYGLDLLLARWLYIITVHCMEKQPRKPDAMSDIRSHPPPDRDSAAHPARGPGHRHAAHPQGNRR